MKLLKNRIYIILLILNALIRSMYCMTPSQTMAELMSSTTGSSSTSSSLSSLLSTTTLSGASNAARTGHYTSSLLLLPDADPLPITSFVWVPQNLIDFGISSNSNSCTNGYTGQPTESVDLTLVTNYPELSISDSGNDTDVTASEPEKEKSEILSALKELGKSTEMPHPLKRARTTGSIADSQLIPCKKKLIHSSGDNIFNIVGLINLIAQSTIGSGTDLARFIQINKSCSKILQGKNLHKFLVNLKSKNTCAYLDIATSKNFMLMINKHLEEQHTALATLNAKKETDKNAAAQLYILNNTYKKELDTLIRAGIKYGNLAIISNLNARNEPLNSEDYLSIAINKSQLDVALPPYQSAGSMPLPHSLQGNNNRREKIITFLLSHNTNLFDTCTVNNTTTGQNILHSLASTHNNTLLNKVLNIIRPKITTPDTFVLLNKKNHNSDNIFHICVYNNNIDGLKMCLNFSDMRPMPAISDRNKEGETPFIIACKYNNVAIINLLLSKLSDYPTTLTIADNNSNTPLYYSIIHNNTELTEFLLSKYSLITSKEGNKVNNKAISKILDHCLSVKNYELFERILKLHPEIVKNELIDESLFYMCTNTDVELDAIKLLVEKYGADINKYPTLNYLILYNGTTENCIPIIKYLIKNGALVTKVFDYTKFELLKNLSSIYQKRSAFEEAIKSSNAEIIKILIKCVDINAIDAEGNTILHNISFENAKLIKKLLQLGANPNTKNKNGQNALHLAMSSESSSDTNDIRLATIKLLIQSGCNILQKDDMGNTPLFYAQFLNNANMFKSVQFLLSHGANLEDKNKYEQTWINYLITDPLRSSIYEDLEKLIKLGCNLNTTDHHGNTPLHNYLLLHSCYRVDRHSEVLATIELLIKNGANLEIRNKQGSTPLHLLIANLDFIVTQKALECRYFEHLDLEDFINLFSSSFSIRNFEGDSPYNLASKLISAKQGNNTDQTNMLLRIMEIIKHSKITGSTTEFCEDLLI